MKTLHLVIGVSALLLAPMSADAGPAARMESPNKLKQIGLAPHSGVEGQKRLRCQAVREAAARMSCTNNLKQIGVALHNSRVDELIRLKTTRSMKCARIEYAYGCLSSDPWNLRRVQCRPGATEASCCRGARDAVTRICGPAWDAAKKSGKTWFPGPFICKCIQKATDRRIRRMPKRNLKRMPR